MNRYLDEHIKNNHREVGSWAYRSKEPVAGGTNFVVGIVGKDIGAQAWRFFVSDDGRVSAGHKGRMNGKSNDCEELWADLEPQPGGHVLVEIRCRHAAQQDRVLRSVLAPLGYAETTAENLLLHYEREGVPDA